MISPSFVVPPQGASSGIWLRCPSVSGSKDWFGFQTQTELVSYWGKTGHVNQSNHKPGGKLFETFRSKKKKGYTEVAFWRPDSGWTAAGQQPVKNPPPPTSQKKIKKEKEKEPEAVTAVPPGAIVWF